MSSRLVKKRRIDSIRIASQIGAAVGVSAAAAFGVSKLVRRISRPEVSLRDKVVLITGGSRGLGLELAKQLGAEGARLALCARDESELEEACARLASRGMEARPFSCDVSKPEEIDPLVTRVIDQFGAIDVLVNDAGHISVGPLDSFTHEDFEDAMNVMFWGPVNLSFAVLPHMKQRRSGHIVNITSVGGRVSVPHLLPYSCAKFALVGFSTGLGTELRGQGVRVLTVVPGLMRTGSYLNAQFKGEARREFAWFSLLGNLPGASVAAEHAARRIVSAIEQGRQTCTISLAANLLIRAEAEFPETTRTIMTMMNRYVLPQSAQKSTHRGKALNPLFNTLFQAVTALGRTAARELNE